ncbi:hypothetical protein G3A43_08190 [Paraburkholderia aspalathi]|nr:hypothetical protein [Paraburkholderia aspalathi]MBK3780235.1 hypothetical protein [Paraburkholderia aspalathi]
MARNRVEQVWERFLEAQGDKPFRRQDLAELLYPLRTPRDMATARVLADRFIQKARRDGKLVKAGHVHWKQVSLNERVLKSGRVVRESHELTALTLSTRCPAKWLALDLESGDVWAGTEKGWTRAPYASLAEAREALNLDGICAKCGDAEVEVGKLLR